MFSCFILHLRQCLPVVQPTLCMLHEQICHWHCTSHGDVQELPVLVDGGEAGSTGHTSDLGGEEEFDLSDIMGEDVSSSLSKEDRLREIEAELQVNPCACEPVFPVVACVMMQANVGSCPIQLLPDFLETCITAIRSHWKCSGRGCLRHRFPKGRETSAVRAGTC